MLVAISQRHDQNKNGWWMDNLESTYNEYFPSWGMTLLIVPNNPALVDHYFSVFPVGGVILTGGNDLDPRLYGENIAWPDISPLRDQTEKRILEIAIARRIPVLGICRGMQFINVFFGGKLVKDIREEITGEHWPGQDHLLTITDEKMFSALGKREVIVNSFHNQAVTSRTLSPQLRSFAVAGHDIVEGLYHPTLPIAGIQWHPERKSPEEGINKKLVEAFVKRELFWKERIT